MICCYKFRIKIAYMDDVCFSIYDFGFSKTLCCWSVSLMIKDSIQFIEMPKADHHYEHGELSSIMLDN